MTHDLVRKVFFSRFLSPILQAGDDSGVFSIPKSTDEQFRFALITDSHVVFPLFFPGGDIGRLAICGTVNDLAVMGAVPLYLTAGFILEEGITIATLKTIADSMGKAAQEAGVQVIAGDTKVVQKGKGDGLYINTSGIGIIPNNLQIHGANARPNDVVIDSGSIGEHWSRWRRSSSR